MGYIKKYTTLFLFFLLVIALVSFISGVVFYQKSFSRLNSDIQTRNKEIAHLNDVVTSLRQNYTRLDEILQLKIQKEEDLSLQYLDMKTVKEGLEEDKVELEGYIVDLSESLNETLTQLTKARLNISILQGEIEDLEIEIDILEEDLSQVLNDTKEICEDSEALNISECEDYQ